MNKINKTLLTLGLVATAVVAPVKNAEARPHFGGFRGHVSHCHSSRHFWGGVVGGVVGGLVGGYVARPYYHTTPYYSTPVITTPVVTTPYYSTPVVTYPTTTVVQQPAPAPQQTVVREVIKEVAAPAPTPAPKQNYPKLNPGDTMTMKPDGTIIITRGKIAPIPAKVQERQRTN